MSTFNQTMVGAMVLLNSIYKYSEQNDLVNYTGYTERWGIAEMWNGVRDPTDNFQEEEEEICKAKISQTDTTKSTLAKTSSLLFSSEN